MIIVDTNVVSELMRLRPDPVVADWMSAQKSDDLYLSAVTVAELLLGVARMPVGKRQIRLAGEVAGLLDEDFRGRVLPFDESAAVEFASLASGRLRRGHSVGYADTQIAAIAVSSGAVAVATRNTLDFTDVGLPLINPWL